LNIHLSEISEGHYGHTLIFRKIAITLHFDSKCQTGKMSISDGDIKLLWGRAAGICSNPTCQLDLTKILTQSDNYIVGEMAHVIAKSENGPRGISGGGSDSYENLILLCPTCHRHIDKSPMGTYTVEQLHEWKQSHESSIRAKNRELKFSSINELKTEITRLLLENNMLWTDWGPQSQIAREDPGSNSFNIWNLRKLDTIIPNNQKIINMIESNKSLLDSAEYEVFLQFKNHATSFEEHQYNRLDNYPIFPQSFSEIFKA